MPKIFITSWNEVKGPKRILQMFQISLPLISASHPHTCAPAVRISLHSSMQLSERLECREGYKRKEESTLAVQALRCISVKDAS